MDSRLLTACRLLMEVAAAQLDGQGRQTVNNEQRTVDTDELRTGNHAHREPEPPVITYGDNPNFDPARFAELRRGQQETVVRPHADTVVPEPEPIRTLERGGWGENGEEFIDYVYPNEPPGSQRPMTIAQRPAPAPPLSTLNSPLSTPGPSGPPATLTMQDISDHFERDARRY